MSEPVKDFDSVSKSYERRHRRTSLETGVLAQWDREFAERDALEAQTGQETQQEPQATVEGNQPDDVMPEAQKTVQPSSGDAQGVEWYGKDQPVQVGIPVDEGDDIYGPPDKPNYFNARVLKRGILAGIAATQPFSPEVFPKDSPVRREWEATGEIQSLFGEFSRPEIPWPYTDESQKEGFEGFKNAVTAEQSIDVLQQSLINPNWPLSETDKNILELALTMESQYSDYRKANPAGNPTDFMAKAGYSENEYEAIQRSYKEIIQENILREETSRQDIEFLDRPAAEARLHGLSLPPDAPERMTVRMAFRQQFGEPALTKMDYKSRMAMQYLEEGLDSGTIDQLLGRGPGADPNVFWSPADLAVDVATGGLRPVLGLGIKGAIKAGAKPIAREMALDTGFGVMAGGAMTVADIHLSNDLLTALSGIVTPMGAYAIATMSRVALSRSLAGLATNNKEVYAGIMDAAKAHPNAPLARALNDEEMMYLTMAFRSEWDKIPEEALAKYPKLADVVNDLKTKGAAAAWGLPSATNPRTRRATRNVLSAAGNEMLEKVNRYEQLAQAGKLSGKDATEIRTAYAKYMATIEAIETGPARNVLHAGALTPKIGDVPIGEFGKDVQALLISNKIMDANEMAFLKMAAKGNADEIPDEAFKRFPKLSELVAEIQGHRQKLSAIGLTQEATRQPVVMFLERSKEGGAIDKALSDVGGMQAFIKPIVVPDGYDMPKYAGSLNLSRMNSRDGVLRAINETSKVFSRHFRASQRTPVKQEVSKELAELMGMTTDELLSVPFARAANAHELVAATSVLKTASNTFYDSAKAYHLRVSEGIADEVDAFNLKMALARLELVSETVAGLRSEAGRALNILKDPEVRGAKQDFDMLAEFIRMNKWDDDKLKGLARAITVGDISHPAALRRAGDFLFSAPWTDKLLRYYIAGLLTAPPTHVVNFATNAVFHGWMAAETTIGAGISAFRGANQVSLKDLGHYYTASITGFLDGIKASAKSFKTMEPLFETSKVELANFEKPSRQKLAQGWWNQYGAGPTKEAAEHIDIFEKAVGLLDNTFTMSIRLLGTSDAFYKTMAYNREVKFQASRIATREGLIGKAHSDRVNRIVQNVETELPHLHQGAIEAARYSTFTDELGPTGKSIMRVTENHPMLKVFFPFIRTPTNLMKRSLERTPLAPLSANIRDTIERGGFEADLAMSRIALGSYVMLSAFQFASEGKITGRGPLDPAQKAHLEQTGWRPYSFFVDGNYYSFDRLDPFVFMFGMASDMTEFFISDYVPESMKEDLAAAIVLSFVENTLSKTYIQNLTAVLDALSAKEDTGQISRLFRDIVTAAVPRIVPQTAAELERSEIKGMLTGEEPHRVRMTAVYDLHDKFLATLGMGGELPPNRDMWGDVRYRDGALGPAFLSPITKSEETISPIDSECMRLGISVRKPPMNQSFMGIDVELNPKQYDRFIELAMHEIPQKTPGVGMSLKQFLNEMVETEDYANLPNRAKIIQIQRVINRFRDIAKAAMFIPGFAENMDIKLDRDVLSLQRTIQQGQSAIPLEGVGQTWTNQQSFGGIPIR